MKPFQDGAPVAEPLTKAGKESSLPLDDPRVAQAVREYLAALEAGKKPDRRELQARYPEIAGPLAECLDALEFMHAASPVGSVKGSSAQGESGSVPPQGIPLGDYRILREVGRGGMGVVYEAEQMSLGRRVALKMLPFASALDSKQLQRFRNEAQAAAHLHHQNIVPVYAVGCERGVHYYAMQFIEGQTLAAVIRQLRWHAGLEVNKPGQQSEELAQVAYELVSGQLAPAKRSPAAEPLAAVTPPTAVLPDTVNQSRQPETASAIDQPSGELTPQAGLSTERSSKSPAFFRTVANLGVQAAEALEHAHRSGVVHRDIKPANLLVDMQGNLWITDFGLAHCQSQAGLTMSGDLVGTLRYMSPEQALAQRVLIDHRTDIYSLGVTLYELLTLAPAFGGRDRQELLRQIAFEEPRPLRRVNRATPVELETIVLKAIAKNPAERYATARELGDDLERYLRNEPIRASRPTWTQKARKWAVRHQPVVWSVGVSSVLILILLLLGLSYRYQLLDRKRQELLQKQEEIVQERDAAAKALRQAELLNRFLTSFLSEAAPDRNARDKKVTAEVVFRKAYEKITSDPKLRDDPEVEASLRLTMGDTFNKLGAFDEAEMNLRKAVDLRRSASPPDHPATLAAQEKLADFLNLSLRKPDETLSRQTWEARRRVLGPEDLDTLDSMDTYAMSLKIKKNLASAEKVSREGWEICKEFLGQEHERTLISQNNLATILIDLGQWPEAEELLRQCLEIRRKQPNAMEKEETLSNLNNLCVVRLLLGKNLDAAEKELREGVEIMGRTHGKDFPHTLYVQHVLVRVLLEKHSYLEAEKLGRQTLNMRRAKLRPGHENIGRSLVVLGHILVEQGKFTDAEPLLREAAELFSKNYSERKELVADAQNWQGACLAARKEFGEAERLLLPSYQILKADPAVPERHKAKARDHIIHLYEAWGKREKVAEWRAKP